jgi:prepilin signal peptidase PulO-like enzyme (type II secretory pathway)
MRRTITVAMILIGAGLMLLGYLLSAPWGADSVANSDPRLPFAPAIFVLGVIVVFSSAIVYELIPNRYE